MTKSDLPTESLPEAEMLGALKRVGLVASGVERFTIMRRLGEGGMGTVYAAYDSVLDRKVALKVVRTDRRRTSDPVVYRTQLLREAQAMARLSHPNVVTVHEVGEIAEDIYVVLELVEGTTLHDWLKQPRTWRDIVAAYVQAGRGLEAVHAAGLVHRDFKPSNVLVRDDGRIQVSDFGVVSMGGSSGDSSGRTPEGELTYAGMRVGTPAYMAPEQHAAAAVDARADQFSFCVALWEGLYRVRPFAGTGKALADAIVAGQIQAPPEGAKVPRWLEAPLRRGLAARAEDRWPSMDALLAVLERDPARARRRRLAIGGAATAIVATAIVAAIGWTRRPPAVVPCTDAETHLAGRWDPARAAALRSAFAASQAPYATAAATRVIAGLDAWAPRWAAMRTEACRATRVTGEQSEALLDARMRCLDRQLDEVGELVTSLVTSDRAVITRAAEQLALPDLATCADRDTVLARVPPPGRLDVRARVDRLEHELASISAAERTGRFHDARVRARAVADDALTVGFAPLAAEALLVRGQLEEQDGDLAAARDSLAEAARLAGNAHDDRTIARALVTLLEVLVERAEVPAALALGVAATAAAARNADPVLDAQLAEQLGAAHDAAGDADAETFLRRALALRESAAGSDAVPVAQVLDKLADLDTRRGHVPEARAEYTRALAIVTAQLGPAHPATAITRGNLCYLDAQAGKLDTARACQEEVVTVLERALGPDHPQVAWALNEVALVQREQGDLAGAQARFERALAIWEKASGPEHPDTAWPRINLGEIANARGDHERAAALCRRALETIERASGPTHADTVPALTCLATARFPRAPREALDLARRALANAREPERADVAKWLRDHGSR